MMNDSQSMDQELSVLRWGGLAGILGGLFHILAFIVVAVGPVGIEEPVNLAEWVIRFPAIRMARTVENILYLMALVLGILLFLTLYRTIRTTNLAAALFGSGLSVMGLVVLVGAALPHVATAPLSDIYHAPGASAADQATLVLLWQAAWAILDAFLASGFFVVPLGIITLGVGMFRAPAFGRGFGWATVSLGTIGLVAATLYIIDSSSMIAVATFFSILIFQLVLGWKLYTLSKVPVRQLQYSI